ncbi:DNA cytosine methyltransferase [Variovorax sp. PAMC26660]|uniref:DNA cytosine methyltransferase n=1 Tax=Variovorax sp. PAMC26660 TaxID=2762322 RepID=UPI00164D708C|nr:DNA cytosine methyltransferase [Variovorax sp. PAMC26660]
MNELALFAGAGGGILGGHLLGWRTVCAVERDAYAAQVLISRQNDGALRPFPVWADVCSFDGRPWRGIVDVISGGFPCQDISSAGKGAGLEGDRSGLWAEMARIVGEVRPRYVFVENSPMLTSRGLGVVLGDLAALRFDARWRVLSAADVGAPHVRERIWIVATDANAGELRTSWPAEDRESSAGLHIRGSGTARRMAPWWEVEPEPCSVGYGVAGVVDELRPFGNGQVPQVAATAWQILTETA